MFHVNPHDAGCIYSTHAFGFFRGFATISAINPLLAILVGVVHASISPVVAVSDVKPNLILVAVVLVTAVFGFGPGITWAFLGGLTANLLVGQPLGSIPLGLLLVAALVAGGARVFGGAIWIYPVVAAAVGSVVADVISLLIGPLVADVPFGAVPTDLVLAAAAFNAAIAAVLVYPVRSLAARYVPEEGTAW
jgi:cell shape-determining protein MreD